MKKQTVHYVTHDKGIPTCGVHASVLMENSQLATDRRKVTCENCLKTRAYKLNLDSLQGMPISQVREA